MDLKLKGLKAVVTGGSAGIGLSIVESLAREGCHVVTCSRSRERNRQIQEMLKKYPVEVSVEEMDVSSPEAEAWISSIGPFDIFIPNVSALSGDWQSSIATDLIATVKITEAAIGAMANSKSAAITYVGSKAATFATPNFEAYGATKAASTHYIKSLSQRLAGSIRANVVSPGDTFVEGGFWDKIKKSSPEVYESTKVNNPMKRFCTPQEVANVVVFLSSPAASFVNGSHLLVDGGATVHVHG